MNIARHGTFKVASRFFRDMVDIDGKLNGVNLFAGMIVLDVDIDWHSDSRIYKAAHPQFREVLPGETLPEYTAVFHAGQTEPEWREVTFAMVSDATYDELLAAMKNTKPWKIWQIKPAGGIDDEETPAATFRRIMRGKVRAIAQWWKDGGA